MSAVTRHRLDGFEPDNLLAFLALLGLLRALEAVDAGLPDADQWRPRAGWDTERAPLRPFVQLRPAVTAEALAAQAAAGIDRLTTDHDFGGQADLNYARTEARALLDGAGTTATAENRARADLLTALMCDGVTKDDKDRDAAPVDPTPLCLLFGQGHQHFLERLAAVPRTPAPPPRGKGKKAVQIDAATCLTEALFDPWHYDDPTQSFRWDPVEDVRYALMPGDPTDSVYKNGTQHGANRLATIGLAALTLAPDQRAGRARPTILGGRGSEDGFSFSWPIWSAPISLPAIRALLAHPGQLAEVMGRYTSKRISVGKFMNFTRGRLDGSV